MKNPDLISNRLGRSFWQWPVLAVLGVAIAACQPADIQANELDVLIKDEANEILRYCRKQGWKNVGVLNFQVKVGKEKPSWHVGRLNTIMATRLENALVFANKFRRSGEALVGVTRNAGEVAMKMDKNINYVTRKNRKKLLDFAYPLAWGDKKAKVDVFLTGLVTVTPDLKNTNVTIKAWDRKNTKLRKIASFKAKTDRVTLVDMNRNFSIGARALDKTLGGFEDVAIESATTTAKPDSLGQLLEFKVYYDGKHVPIGFDNGTYEITTPQPNQKVHFELIPKKKNLGVVFLVNGVNTFLKERNLLPQQYSMWVLGKPNEVHKIRGFYAKAKGKVEEFKIVPDGEYGRLPFVDQFKLGKIELYVFVDGIKEKDETVSTNLRGVRRSVKTFDEAINLIENKNKKAKAQRGLILPGAKGKKVNIELVEFAGSALLGNRTIVYSQIGRSN